MAAAVDKNVAYMELIELENGDVVLRRVEDQQVLLQISFGAPTREHLAAGRMEVAKAMVHAGYKTFIKLASDAADQDDGLSVKDSHSGDLSDDGAGGAKDVTASNADGTELGKVAKSPPGSDKKFGSANLFADVSSTVH